MEFDNMMLAEQFIQRSCEIQRSRGEVEMIVRLLCDKVLLLTPEMYHHESVFTGTEGVWKCARFRSPRRILVSCYLRQANGDAEIGRSFLFGTSNGVHHPFHHQAVRPVRAALHILVDGLVKEIPGLEGVVREFIAHS
jgi:hypothetical protein